MNMLLDGAWVMVRGVREADDAFYLRESLMEFLEDSAPGGLQQSPQAMGDMEMALLQELYMTPVTEQHTQRQLLISNGKTLITRQVSRGFQSH